MLTLAFSLDLAWNYATEAQAYDRVHRIGQLKDVIVHRLIIKNTIEERLVRLQAMKQGKLAYFPSMSR